MEHQFLVEDRRRARQPARAKKNFLRQQMGMSRPERVKPMVGNQRLANPAGASFDGRALGLPDLGQLRADLGIIIFASWHGEKGEAKFKALSSSGAARDNCLAGWKQ